MRYEVIIDHFHTDHLTSENAVVFSFSELERLSNLVGKPSENHPLHNSGLLSLDPVQDKTPLYSQLLQAYKWSNKVTEYIDAIQLYVPPEGPICGTANL
uniref:Uncharacterized protein n=1 Tax=Anas zonorhyncha TaxID=75864 RepID=A0A8B9V8F2_9AVES